MCYKIHLNAYKDFRASLVKGSWFTLLQDTSHSHVRHIESSTGWGYESPSRVTCCDSVVYLRLSWVALIDMRADGGHHWCLGSDVGLAKCTLLRHAASIRAIPESHNMLSFFCTMKKFSNIVFYQCDMTVHTNWCLFISEMKSNFCITFMVVLFMSQLQFSLLIIGSVSSVRYLHYHSV